jgi:FixJ family two-component response regulator
VAILRTPVVAVVEDDAAMRQALRRVLETNGFATEVFNTAEAFLASGAASRVRCLVLDIHLPGMSGIDMHRHLLATGNAVATIFITAHDDPALRRLASQQQAGCYLVKPFLGETLTRAVARAVGA